MNYDEQRKFSCELFKNFLQNLWHIPKTLWNLHLLWDFAVFCIISWVCLFELWSKDSSSRLREVRFHPWNMFSSPLNFNKREGMKWVYWYHCFNFYIPIDYYLLSENVQVQVSFNSPSLFFVRTSTYWVSLKILGVQWQNIGRFKLR